MSPAFVQEQEHKPQLAKEIEGTTAPIEELQKSFPSAETVGKQIIAKVNRGDFAIAEDSWESSLLFANMVGPSPKRGWGFFDSFFAIIVGLFVWPILRRRFDHMASRDGKN
jgi:3-dehydrosphinganine reductase